jgi:hypothetical protein
MFVASLTWILPLTVMMLCYISIMIVINRRYSAINIEAHPQVEWGGGGCLQQNQRKKCFLTAQKLLYSKYKIHFTVLGLIWQNHVNFLTCDCKTWPKTGEIIRLHDQTSLQYPAL